MAEAAELDLSRARVFVETGPPIAGGRWYRLPDDTVIYQRPSGERVYPAIVSASTLEHSGTWTEVSAHGA